MNKDPVMVDLERYLDTLEEDYVDPAEHKLEMEEYLADHPDWCLLPNNC